MNGAATSLENVRMFGNVYMSSCRVGSDKGLDAFVTSGFCPKLVRIWLSSFASAGDCDLGGTGDLELFSMRFSETFDWLLRTRFGAGGPHRCTHTRSLDAASAQWGQYWNGAAVARGRISTVQGKRAAAAAREAFCATPSGQGPPLRFAREASRR